MHNATSPLTFVSVTLLAAVGCGGSIDLESSRRFQEAQETFAVAQTPEEFLTAAGIYREILDSGVVSGAVLYNQGNAFMRAGERGRAIAAYRQAKRYRPRDPYLDANLNYALGNVAGEQAERPVLRYLLFWQDWLSYPEKFQLAFLAALVTTTLALIALFLAHPRPVRRAAFALLAVTAVLAGSAGYDWYHFEVVTHGVVVDKETVARKGNDASYEPAFTEPLPEGTEATVLESRGDWLLVRIGPAKEGWVDRRSVVTY